MHSPDEEPQRSGKLNYAAGESAQIRTRAERVMLLMACATLGFLFGAAAMPLIFPRLEALPFISFGIGYLASAVGTVAGFRLRDRTRPIIAVGLAVNAIPSVLLFCALLVLFARLLGFFWNI